VSDLNQDDFCFNSRNTYVQVSQNSRIPKSERGREGPSSKSAPSDQFFFFLWGESRFLFISIFGLLK
jgi:hypothetical protein